MNIIFNGKLTGAEIALRNPMKILEANTIYDYSEGDKTGKNGIIDCICNRETTDEEKTVSEQEQSDTILIAKLKETIENKKLLDMDCTDEQAQLKLLLGL